MKQKRFLKSWTSYCCGFALVVASSAKMFAADGLPAPALEPGSQIEITVTNADLPPTLYSLMNYVSVPPCVTIRLPDDYNPTNTYPLVLYVPGGDGSAKGNIQNAVSIAGQRGWIAATVPLFKKTIDPTEPARGFIVSFEDYPVISRAYGVLLGRMFEVITNVDPERSAMVGFSNGSITAALLVSNHDEFILAHFRNFCLVDHGMFHLTDLHKRGARQSKFLLLVGDQPDFGRDTKIRQAKLQEDAWKLLGVDVTCRVMEHTGHEFNEPQMQIVRQWLRTEVVASPQPKPATATSQP